MSSPSKSHLFIAYNAAKPFVKTGAVDGKRLNKALGIAQQASNNHIERYGSTADDCHCPDRMYRLRKQGKPCKGMLAVALLDAITGPQEAA